MTKGSTVKVIAKDSPFYGAEGTIVAIVRLPIRVIFPKKEEIGEVAFAEHELQEIK